ncbi:MAG: PepSY domain-containing protein [Alphaproteobacteria bacterium]|nr:PepSY domain-containing protein [Alphaproteobacteria bacterium]
MSIRTTLACATFLTTIAIAGHAQSISEQVVDQLTEQGYSRIEVKTRDNQVKVEAIRGDRQLEVTYDATTGDVLKQEVNDVEDHDGMMNGMPGDDDQANEDSDDDNSGRGRGRGRGGDDAEDDDHGSDGMNDDDGSDDDGDDHDHDSGDRGGHGGDNASGGSDDNGGKSDGGRHGGEDRNDNSDDD